MIKVNENKETSIKIIKHYIKDLSFENPQSINDNNSLNNNDCNLFQNLSFTYLSYKNNFFSVVMKYNCEGSSKKNGNKLFVLELEYFGFFKINDNQTYDQADLTKRGGKLILPFVRSIIKNVTDMGGSKPIYIQDVDFDLIKG